MYVFDTILYGKFPALTIEKADIKNLLLTTLQLTSAVPLEVEGGEGPTTRLARNRGRIDSVVTAL